MMVMSRNLRARYAREESALVQRNAIDEAFEAARHTVEQLEAERDAREQWLDAWRPGDRP